MEKKDSDLQSFRAGDYRRATPRTRHERTGEIEKSDLKHFPFLEKLLESEEEEIEKFQLLCQNTCRNIDTMMTHQSADPEMTVMCQSALAAYGQSLKLLSELITLKYEKLQQQSDEK
ncbi:MAG: hypothetical protein JXQ27_12885 [Acidobacteria bacterium]|nr:hypothetical protein [Acidobacteriota bacterium]